jgi:hypothetical protein
MQGQENEVKENWRQNPPSPQTHIHTQRHTSPSSPLTCSCAAKDSSTRVVTSALRSMRNINNVLMVGCDDGQWWNVISDYYRTDCYY